MSQEQRVHEDRQFIETCLELQLLEPTDVDSLRASIGRDSGFIGQTAVQRGLLTPADVDIVQSLQFPTKVVPGYRVLGLIGRGGMGVVYRAEQIDLERIVALKTILISSVSDPTVSARFEREAKALARLQHPNIVQALNFGKHEGRYYFAMEYVPGRTCEQAVRETGHLPADQVWSIVRQVSAGLMHALRQNLIHRDIKPANLILVPPPEGSSSATEIVKIADFGLAMFADQSPDQLKLTTGDKIMGSPAYMSLEQFGGRPVDFRSDMYALGATAWHLLFGVPPFQGGNIATLFRQKSERLIVDPSTLPVVLPQSHMRLLIGLLDPDPNQRPQNYEQLIDAIDMLGVSETSPPSATAFTTTDQVQPPTIPVSEQATISGSVALLAQPESPTPAPDLASEGMSQTIDLPMAAKAKPVGRFLFLFVVTCLLVVSVVVTLSLDFSGRGPRTHTRVISNTPLFDGVTLSGWDVGGSMVGAWNTVEAPDSSTAIACTTSQGALTRRFSDRQCPRISLFVWLQRDGGPVDIDFALDSSKPADVRGCLRLSGEDNQLGKKTSDFGTLDIVATTEALPTVFDRYHVVHIERQPTDWYVFLEERLVGTLPIKRVGDSPSIRLVVHGNDSGQSNASKAFFADVQLCDLRPKADEQAEF